MHTENFETWDFIEKYYPNYYSCDYILLNDIFTRKLNNEYVCNTDKIFLKTIDFRKELIILALQDLEWSHMIFLRILKPNLVL